MSRATGRDTGSPFARLRGRSVGELRDRAVHRVRTMAERAGVRPVPSWPEATERDPRPERPGGGPDGMLLDALPVSLRDALVSRADDAAVGRFALLGHPPHDYGLAPDWQRDPRSGRVAPRVHWSRVPYLDVAAVGDHKVTWELARHQWLLWLAQGWCLARDPRHPAAAAALLDHWLRENPPKVGMHWTSALELSFRCLAWTHALPLLVDAPAIDAVLRRRLAESVLVQMDHVAWNLSRWFSPNTHLTGEALALYVTGCAWPMLPGAAARRELGWRVLVEQLPVQVRPDGSYFEQSTWYQAYTVDFYVEALRWARHEGRPVPVGMRARLLAAARFLRAMTRADGTVPLVGDDDGGRLWPLLPGAADDVSDVLARAAIALDDPDLAVPGTQGVHALPWTHGVGTVSRGTHDESEGRVAREGGWVVMRERRADGREHHLVLDAGPHGALTCGHAHADALAVVLTVAGRHVVVDPGTFAYVGAARDRYRATAAHATVTVDGIDSSEQGSSFRWRSVARSRLLEAALAPDADWAMGVHEGYGRLPDPVGHRRLVMRLPRSLWIMLDTLTCAASHAVGVSLPLAAGAAVTLDADAHGARVAVDDVSVRVAGEPALAWAVEPATVSRAYGAEVPAPRLVGRATVAGTTTLCTVLADAQECAVDHVERMGAASWAIVHRDGRDLVTLADGAPVDFDGGRFDGRWLVIRSTLRGERAVVAAGPGTLEAAGQRVAIAAGGVVRVVLETGAVAAGRR